MPLQTDPATPASGNGRPRLTIVAPAELGLGTEAVALPSEHALLLRVALPLAAHRQRLAAIGFAVEDLIAEPLEAVHVALGPELAPGEYLAVVVRHAVMADWAPRAHAAAARLVPDVLGLPVPPEGRVSVREIAGRILVRRADGTGYAAQTEAFEVLWRADGTPQIVLFGGRLPETLPVSAAGLMPALSTDAARLDLLQGVYARDSGGRGRIAGRLALVIGLALAAHGAILGAETFALQGIAQEREATLRAALAARVPDLPAGLPLDAALQRALPQAADAAGGFIPLLARVSEVLAPLAGEMALRNLAYAAADGSLALLVEAPDLATLQRIESDLAAAGLAVSAGVATTGNGAAEVRYVIGGAGG